MASKVFLRNKKSGRTYVYHNISYWDKDEKKPKSKRNVTGQTHELYSTAFTPMMEFFGI